MRNAARNFVASAIARSDNAAACCAEPRTAVVEPPFEHDSPSADEHFARPEAVFPDERAKRQRYLELAIRQRIESRLPGRVRNLVVRVIGDRVLIDGQCATYYSKQLAQHAALGVLNE